MTEEDLEEAITPEVVPSQELSTVIKEVGLDQQLANEFRINFEQHFRMASTWAKKAKNIIVTDPSQIVVMQEARQARLFLRSKRLEIEQFRVAKKEYYLKGGRAIDKVANFLKDTIIPIEEHLDRQEHFVELRKKAEDERILAEAHSKMEADALAEQQRLAEETKKIREENEKLKAENKVKEEIARKFAEQKEAELQEERNKALRIERELQLRKQAELKAEADKIREEESLLKAGDTEKLQAFRRDVLAIKIPEVKSAENKRIIEDAKSHLYLAIIKIKQEEEI